MFYFTCDRSLTVLVTGPILLLELAVPSLAVTVTVTIASTQAELAWVACLNRP